MGSALALAGKPVAASMAVTVAPNARIAEPRTVDSDPSRPALHRPAIWLPSQH
jgi:hypothetical protein